MQKLTYSWVKPKEPAGNSSNSISVNNPNNICEQHNYIGSCGPPIPGRGQHEPPIRRTLELSPYTLG